MSIPAGWWMWSRWRWVPDVDHLCPQGRFLCPEGTTANSPVIYRGGFLANGSQTKVWEPE